MKRETINNNWQHRHRIAMRKDLVAQELMFLAQDEHPLVRCVIAMKTMIPQAATKLLARDSNRHVKEALVKHTKDARVLMEYMK